MSRPSVNTISMATALVAGVLSLVILLLPGTVPERNILLLTIAIPAGLTIVVFLVMRLILNRFIRSHILPLYRSIHRISTGDKKPVSFHGRDLIAEVEDEIHHWEEANRQAIEKMKMTDTYRREFLGNVYHELKTPIFNMQGYILTLLDGGLEDKSINRVYLERTEKNINRMISIVEDLESIGRLESGALNLKIESFSIKKLIEDVIEANEIRATKNDISLEVNRIRESDTRVMADRKRIYQVLNNLIINSISYGYRGGKTVVSVQPAGDSIIVEVKDDGIGMDKSEIPRVFERFYRVDKSRSRDSGGTGLGLAIVKHIIEAHKQTVTVRSTLGKGTTFTFTLARG